MQSGASGGDGRLRIVVAEDHPLVLEAIVGRLSADPGFEVVATVGDGEALIATYDRLVAEGTEPDVVLSDHLLPRRNGIDATRELVAHHPNARVIILSAVADEATVAAAMAAGASGYLVKSLPGEELHDKVRAAANGEVVYDSESARLLMGAARQQSRAVGMTGGQPLSAREREVLALVADGLSNTAIAAELYLSPQTVKTHLDRIFTKLGVSGRAAAVRRGIETGAIVTR